MRKCPHAHTHAHTHTHTHTHMLWVSAHNNSWKDSFTIYGRIYSFLELAMNTVLAQAETPPPFWLPVHSSGPYLPLASCCQLKPHYLKYNMQTVAQTEWSCVNAPTLGLYVTCHFIQLDYNRYNPCTGVISIYTGSWCECVAGVSCCIAYMPVQMYESSSGFYSRLGWKS